MHNRCCDETINTLKFASRAKLIKTSAKVNEVVDDKTLLRVYREEIEQLRAKLEVYFAHFYISCGVSIECFASF